MDNERKIEWKLQIHHLHLALLLAGIFLFATTRLLGLDIWWHLAVGKYLLETWKFPARDVFSFTGGAWDNKEWLFGIFVYLIQKAGGVNLLSIAKAALFTATFLVLYILAVRRSGNRYISLGVVLLAALACRLRIAFRPELASFLFIAILLLFLDEYLKGRRKPLCLFPLLMLLWVNIHPLAFLGLLILAIYVIGGIICLLARQYANRNGWRVLSGRGLLLLLLILVASSVAFICNPISLQRFLSPFELMTKHGAYLADLTETKPLPIFQFPSVAAFALLAVFTLVMFVSVMEPSDTIILISFGLISITMARNAPLLPICGAAIIASQLARFLSSAQNWSASVSVKWRRIGDGAVALLLVAVIVWAVLLPNFGVGYSALLYPEGAARYISTNLPQGEMFNIYDWGGYLIWTLFPKYRVFMDGRGPDVYSPAFWAEYQTVELGNEGWERILDRYGVNFILISTGNKLHNLISKLNEARSWRLVYWDFQSMLFLREIPSNSALLKSAEYQVFDGDKVDFKAWIPPLEMQIVGELQDYLKTHPDSLQGRSLLASVYLRRGQTDQAIGEFEKVLAYHSKTPRLNFNLGMLYSQKGAEEKAIAAYEKEIAIDGKFPPAYNNLGRIYYEKGDIARASKYFKSALKVDPRYVHAINNLGLVYMDEGRYKEAVSQFARALEVEPKYEGAARNLSLAKEMLANPAETCNRLGQIYYSQGNLDMAEKQFEKALKHDPRYAVAIGNLGVVSMRRGKYEESLKRFREALAINPADEAARRNMEIAETMARQGRGAIEGR